MILPLTLRQQSSLFLSNRLSFGIKKLSLPFTSKNLCNSVTTIAIVHSVTVGARRKTSLNSLLRTGSAPTVFHPISPLPFETFWNMSKDDMPEYLTEIERLKKKYSDRLEIYVGLEIDFLDESYNASIPYFRNLPLDYRIGSIHFLPDRTAACGREYGVYRRSFPGVPEVCRRLLRRRYPQAGRPLFQFHTANDRGRAESTSSGTWTRYT